MAMDIDIPSGGVFIRASLDPLLLPEQCSLWAPEQARESLSSQAVICWQRSAGHDPPVMTSCSRAAGWDPLAMGSSGPDPLAVICWLQSTSHDLPAEICSGEQRAAWLGNEGQHGAAELSLPVPW